MNLDIWLQDEKTREIRKRIKEYIEQKKDELSLSSNLLTKDLHSLGMDYSFNLGYLEGLRFFEVLIDQVRGEDDNE